MNECLELRAPRFDPMMLESLWREESLSRMARSTTACAGNTTQMDELAKRILPPCITEYLDAGWNGDESGLHAEILTMMLALLCIQTIAEAPFPYRQEALKVLGRITPLDPQHPLFAIAFAALIGCSLDETVPGSVRCEAAGLIDRLGERLPR